MPRTRQETQPFSENATALETAANAVVITTALETAANAVVITDGKGVILWVNPAFTSLTGRSEDGQKSETAQVRKTRPAILQRPLDHRSHRQNMARRLHEPSQGRKPLPG